jgi:glycosyltransferase involved in cell wall biosynthesis
MRERHHDADILVTDWDPGPDYTRARRDGWPIEAICAGQRWLRRRLETVLDRLSSYDVVINNHSTVTRLVLPALPATMIRLSVVRSTAAPIIESACHNSQYLDSLVGISPQVTSLLEHAKASAGIQTIPNAVLVHNDHLPPLASPLRIIFVGRLDERSKNILILPDIAKSLLAKRLAFTLTVVGDGPHRKELEQKIARMHLTSVVNVCGAMSRDAAWSLLCSSHFSLVPSTVEGFGLVVAESMGAGAVPVVSDIPVFRWILGEVANALVASVKDPDAYAGRICRLAAHPDQYRYIQNHLRRRQRENFSPETTVGNYLRLIEALRENHKPERFSAVPLKSLILSKQHKHRCSRTWWFLQKIRDGLCQPARAAHASGQAASV